ncbi:MAG: hypothetical protein QM758_07220 [Armatimonas sp.]
MRLRKTYCKIPEPDGQEISGSEEMRIPVRVLPRGYEAIHTIWSPHHRFAILTLEGADQTFTGEPLFRNVIYVPNQKNLLDIPRPNYGMGYLQIAEYDISPDERYFIMKSTFLFKTDTRMCLYRFTGRSAEVYQKGDILKEISTILRNKYEKYLFDSGVGSDDCGVKIKWISWNSVRIFYYSQDFEYVIHYDLNKKKIVSLTQIQPRIRRK